MFGFVLDVNLYWPPSKINDWNFTMNTVFGPENTENCIVEWWVDIFCDWTHQRRIYKPLHSDLYLPHKTVKHTHSIMVWSRFSYYCIGNLITLHRNVKMNQEVNLNLLNDCLPNWFGSAKAKILMQDEAPYHNARCVKQWLNGNEVNYFKDWPRNSLNLNPFENLWFIVKQWPCETDMSSVTKLEEAVKQVWGSFPHNYSRILLTAFPTGKRVKISAPQILQN